MKSPKDVTFADLIARKDLRDLLPTSQLQDLFQRLKSMPSIGGSSNISRWPTPAAMAQELSGKYLREKWEPADHLIVLSDKLTLLAKGEAEIPRLMISMPPRHGKSRLCSFWFPLWLLSCNPDRHIIMATYSDQFAGFWGRSVRNFIAEYGDELGLTLRKDSRASDEWQLTTRGGMLCAGLRGGITGRGSTCIPAGVMVETRDGPIDIATLYQSYSKHEVLCYDHSTGATAYRRIRAAKRSLQPTEESEQQSAPGVLPCSKLVQQQGIHYAVPQITASVSVDRGTGRPRISVQGTRSRECPVCGQALWRKSRICKKCYLTIRRTRVDLLCSQCGREFTRGLYEERKSRQRGHTARYCSQTCSKKHHAVKNRRLCACGAPTRTKTSRYCQQCFQTRPTKKLQQRHCPQCGLYFQPKSHRTMYCSRSCANEAHSHRMRGWGNSHYKDGSSYAKLFQDMKRLVILPRDGWHCIACQGKHRILVHHIDHNPQNNAPANLLTLCSRCHARHHKSKKTPFPWFGAYAQAVSLYMTSTLKSTATSLLEASSSTTA